MNKEFIKKMIIAEKYKYEALKEILPVELKIKLKEMEKVALEIAKDVAIEMMKDSGVVEKSNKSVKKVDIDFSN